MSVEEDRACAHEVRADGDMLRQMGCPKRREPCRSSSDWSPKKTHGMPDARSASTKPCRTVVVVCDVGGVSASEGRGSESVKKTHVGSTPAV